MATNSLEIESNMTLHKMLAERIEVPIIQRDYAQGRKNVKEIRSDFLKDIFSHLAAGQAMKLSFVYGTRNGGIYVPYDGQQRLTLIYLVTLYLSAYCSDWESIKTLAQFNYYTRDYATAFCTFLTGFESDYPEGSKNVFQRISVETVTNCSEAIKNDSGFFGSWKYEPTVASMLVVLQAIHEEFAAITTGQNLDEKKKTAEKYLEDIEKGRIFFDWCPIQASDNIYIKMNGRGKPLSAFDNFKNTLYSELDKLRLRAIKDGQTEKVDFLKNFEIKMDGVWTDLFWTQRNAFDGTENYNIAPFMMNYLYYIFELRHFVSSESFFFGGKDSFRWINEKNVVTFLTKFKDLCHENNVGKKGAITIDDYIWASKLLDIVASRLSKSGTNISIEIDGYSDEKQLLKELASHVGKVASSQTVIVSSLYYEYIISVSSFDANGMLLSSDLSNRDSWIKLINRLMRTAGSFKARYDSLVRDKHILAGYAKMFITKAFENNPSGNLQLAATNITDDDLKNMKKYFDTSHMYSQLVEEIVKNRLIATNASVWTTLIETAENELAYFGNMIYFMFEISKNANGTIDEKVFADYLNEMKKIVNSNGVVNQNKVSALMLSIADYRIASGEGYSNSLSLCSNNSSESFSWRYFFDVLEGDIVEKGKHKVDVIKTLLNFAKSYPDVEACYQGLAKNATRTGWRDVVINYPDILNQGSKHRIIYFENGNHFLIRSEGVVKQVHTNSLYDSVSLELYGLFMETTSSNVKFDNSKIMFGNGFFLCKKGNEYSIKDASGERLVQYDEALQYLNAL